MRAAAVIFAIVLALVCIYWTFDYLLRRGAFRRRRRP
jgi:preprotein translocase subunit SecE